MLILIVIRHPPFGSKLIAQARSFPQFILNITVEAEEVVTEGIKVTLQVEAGLAVVDPPPTMRKGRGKYWASVLFVTSDGVYIECVMIQDSFCARNLS